MCGATLPTFTVNVLTAWCPLSSVAMSWTWAGPMLCQV